MSTSVKKMTAEELIRLPADGQRYELVRGELRQMSPAGSVHGCLSIYIGGHLFQYVRAHRLGRVYGAETGFLIADSPDTVRAPDVAFVSQERLDVVGQPEGYWP